MGGPEPGQRAPWRTDSEQCPVRRPNSRTDYRPNSGHLFVEGTVPRCGRGAPGSPPEGSGGQGQAGGDEAADQRGTGRYRAARPVFV